MVRLLSSGESYYQSMKSKETGKLMFKHMVFFCVDLLDSPRDGESVAGDVLVGHEVEHHVVLLVGDWDQVNKAPER